tara:strand:- start:338 stop:472 length:135 start_codon:yes stop_codon:yes gene_type:complete
MRVPLPVMSVIMIVIMGMVMIMMIACHPVLPGASFPCAVPFSRR